jgi:hypothetical protein
MKDAGLHDFLASFFPGKKLLIMGELGFCFGLADFSLNLLCIYFHFLWLMFD